MLVKNQAGQKLAIYIYDTATDLPALGDAANITAEISLDGGALAPTNDVNPAEIGGGVYYFDLTQAETDADLVILVSTSTTSGVIGLPVILHTRPSTAVVVDAVWDEDIVADHGTADTSGLIVSQLTKRTDVPFNTEVADGSVFGQMADDGTASFDRTTDSLQAIADASSAAADQMITATGAIDSASGDQLVLNTDLVEATDDHFNKQMVIVTSGIAAGRVAIIKDYTAGTPAILNLYSPGMGSDGTTDPQSGDTFVIVAETGGGGAFEDFLQTVLNTSPIEGTVEQALLAALAAGFGKLVRDEQYLTLYSPDGVTELFKFLLSGPPNGPATAREKAP